MDKHQWWAGSLMYKHNQVFSYSLVNVVQTLEYIGQYDLVQSTSSLVCQEYSGRDKIVNFPILRAEPSQNCNLKKAGPESSRKLQTKKILSQAKPSRH